jgi:hypothetical protein
MVLTIALAFVAGFFAGNGLPYYTEGSAGRGVNPSPFPDSSVVNVIVGSTALLIAGVAAYVADIPARPVPGVIAAAAGWLTVGLIHARNWQANPWRKRTSALD